MGHFLLKIKIYLSIFLLKFSPRFRTNCFQALDVAKQRFDINYTHFTVESQKLIQAIELHRFKVFPSIANFLA